MAVFIGVFDQQSIPLLTVGDVVSYAVFVLIQGVFWYYGLRLMVRGFRARKTRSSAKLV